MAIYIYIYIRTQTTEDSAERSNRILQRGDGRSNNISGQIQSESVRDSEISQGSGRQRSLDKWKMSLLSYLNSPEDMERCNGIMGVPITFLDKYNPDQFELLGMMASTQITDYNFGYPFINGKKRYARILIRRKV